MITEENKVILKGYIQNIGYSHTINDVEYNKAQLIVKKDNGREDIINLMFKKFSNPYNDGDYVELMGNLRSFSKRLPEGKNSVTLYVFTYFDKPSIEDADEDTVNQVFLNSRICKIEELNKTKTGKSNIHFILANNIKTNNGKLNSYIPSVAWGKIALQFAKKSVNNDIIAIGQLHSREYKKVLPDGDFELKIAHELLVTDFIPVECTDEI